ncbi:MAG TPA: tail fiber domain-containing protein [Prolixibacteraceae bacterium]
MKTISMVLTIGFTLLTLCLTGQIKIISNGNVGINTSDPAYKLDINSIESRFYYPGRSSLSINHQGLDPRLNSNDKIVFFQTNGSGHAKIECQVVLQNSDISTKENIASLQNKGLETVAKLKGVSFNSTNDPNKRKEFGFLTHDMEPVIPEAVFKNDSTSDQSLAYSYVIPFLVEAIKEQMVKIDELTTTIASLKEELVLKGIITSSTLRTIQNSSENKARLDQNIPNPFTKVTQIGCFIPRDSNSSYIYNYSINGTPLQRYPIQGKEKQVVTIDGTHLVPGIYLYKLIVDGQEIDTKKMILAK